jgi:hypothetical protein
MKLCCLCIQHVAQTILTGHNRDWAMSNEFTARADPDQPLIYSIRIKGHLGRQWADWFEGLTVTLEDNGDTLLAGPVVDQAALHSVLKKVRDLGMPLLSVDRVKPGKAPEPQSQTEKRV